MSHPAGRPQHAVDPQLRAAVANNAAWCAAMCHAHGLTTSTDGRRWWSGHRSPLYYPDAITLDPATDATALLAGIDTAAGCSVKDSFAALDLTSSGFERWFGATWIHRPAGPSTVEPALLRGTVVHDATGLAAWWQGSGDGAQEIFVPDLLEDPDVRLVSVTEGAEVSAVAVLNRAAGVVGVSNLVCAQEAAVEAWQSVIGVATAEFPGLDLVGYEGGDDLAPAVAAGFRTIGQLQVWGR